MNGENFEIELDFIAIVCALREFNEGKSDSSLKEEITELVELGFKNGEEFEEEVNKKFNKKRVRESLMEDEFTKGLAELIAILGGTFNGSK